MNNTKDEKNKSPKKRRPKNKNEIEINLQNKQNLKDSTSSGSIISRQNNLSRDVLILFPDKKRENNFKNERMNNDSNKITSIINSSDKTSDNKPHFNNPKNQNEHYSDYFKSEDLTKNLKKNVDKKNINDTKEKACPEEEDENQDYHEGFIIHDSKEKKNESDNDTKAIKNTKNQQTKKYKLENKPGMEYIPSKYRNQITNGKNITDTNNKKENSYINEVSNDTSANTIDINNQNEENFNRNIVNTLNYNTFSYIFNINQNFVNQLSFNRFNSNLQLYLNRNFMHGYFLYNSNNNLQYLNNMNNFNINNNLQNQEQQLNNTLNSSIIINRIFILFLLNLTINQIPFSSTEANIRIEEDSNIPGYKKVTKIKYKSILKKDSNNKKTKIDLEKIKNGKEKRTSIIVKNIPFHLNVYEIIKIIDKKLKIDFKKRNRTYNFIYVPPGIKYGKNRGFFFINFVSPKHIIKFYKSFEGAAFAPNKQKKICHISLSYSKFKTRAQIIFNDIENNLENF